MHANITIEEAQAKLSAIIGGLSPGEEIVITKSDQPVAKLVSQQHSCHEPRKPGSAKGILVIHADDDDHLKDFEPYMS